MNPDQMTIADYLETDHNYLDFFKEAINIRINYFEQKFTFGDSVSVQLFYLKKSSCKNSMEALTKLVISDRFHQGVFRQSDSDELEKIFNAVKDDLKLDVYFNSKMDKGNIDRLQEDFGYFSKNKLVKHYQFEMDGTMIMTEDYVSDIIDECLISSKNIIITEWNYPSFEYFIETNEYFVLYSFSTGA